MHLGRREKGLRGPQVPVGWTGRNLGTWAENLQSLRGLRAFTDAEAATLEAKSSHGVRAPFSGKVCATAEINVGSVRYHPNVGVVRDTRYTLLHSMQSIYDIVSLSRVCTIYLSVKTPILVNIWMSSALMR